MERLRSCVKSQFKAQEVGQLKTGVSPMHWLLAFESACLLCHNFVGFLADFFDWSFSRLLKKCAELLDDGSIEITFAYHNGDEAILRGIQHASLGSRPSQIEGGCSCRDVRT